MAEFVDSQMQNMVQEMKFMERINLYNMDDLKNLSKRRKDLEYKLKKHTKSKIEYQNYITFETNLYQDIKRRRELRGIKRDMDKIDLSVARRIDALYKNALNSFPNDVRMWVAYIQFCSHVGFLDSISKAFTRMLQINMDKPQLWHMAAKWEKETNGSVENALGYLVRGLTHHPNDALLHTEAFYFTLLQARDKDIPDISQAEVMYNSALKNVRDVEFIIGLLKISEQFHFAELLQKKIIDDLKSSFPKEEIVWHTIAQKSLINKGSAKITSTERFQSCLAIYKEAVTNLPTTKMWGLFIDSIIELNREVDVYITDEREALEEALEKGHELSMLSVKHYLHWLQILDSQLGSENKILKVMDEAIKKNKQSLELWQSLLRYQIVRNDSTKAEQVFDQAVEALGEDALPIWKIMIMYRLSIPHDTENNVRNLFMKAVLQPGKVAQAMKPKYLDWLAVTKNITWARRAYLAMAMRPPHCLELHQKMAQLESLQLEPDLAHWRVCHDNATSLFGKTNKDVWIDYIKFEMNDGDAMRVPEVYNRAKETLISTLIDMFELDYSQVTSAAAENDE